MSQACIAPIVLTLLLAGASAWGQSPREKARIDFEVGKKALAAGEASSALKRFEAVLAVLGPLPELHFYAAKAAMACKDLSAAKVHVKGAFESADGAFRQGKDYPALIALSTDLELALEKEAVAKTESEKLRNSQAMSFQLASRLKDLKLSLLSAVASQTNARGPALNHPEKLLSHGSFNILSGKENGKEYPFGFPVFKFENFAFVDYGIEKSNGKLLTFGVIIALKDNEIFDIEHKNKMIIYEGEIFFKIQPIAVEPATDWELLNFILNETDNRIPWISILSKFREQHIKGLWIGPFDKIKYSVIALERRKIKYEQPISMGDLILHDYNKIIDQSTGAETYEPVAPFRSESVKSKTWKRLVCDQLNLDAEIIKALELPCLKTQ